MSDQQFYSYKKLVIFGSEKTGKASFTKRLENGAIEDVPEDKDRSKFINFIFLINIKIKY